MNNKILVVGLACLSAVAMGQSDANKEKAKATDKPATTVSGDPHEVVAPRDAATGQASGKRMHKPITVTAEVGVEAPTASKEVSKKSASDDWQAPAAKTSQPKITENQKRVAAGDVNGDGKADAATPKNPGQPTLQNTAATSAASEVKSPRDVASGQASGRRAPQPIGSSGQDGVNTAREASSGMATGRKTAAAQGSNAGSKPSQQEAPKK